MPGAAMLVRKRAVVRERRKVSKDSSHDIGRISSLVAYLVKRVKRSLESEVDFAYDKESATTIEKRKTRLL